MSDVTCNLCDTVQDTTDWIEHVVHDGDELDVICQNCKEEIEVSVSIKVSYENLADRY